MSIQELFSKFKGTLRDTDYQLSALIVVVALGSFALGRVSDTPLTPIDKLEVPQNTARLSGATTEVFEEALDDDELQGATADSAGGYVASKNGTKYHLPWCPGAKQIKDENKLFFATKAEAEKAGYTPAANCKGI